jgi:hypothetical protein
MHAGRVAGTETFFAVFGLIDHFDLLESRLNASRRPNARLNLATTHPEGVGRQLICQHTAHTADQRAGSNSI